MKIKSIAKLLLAAAIMQVAVACGGSKPVIDPLDGWHTNRMPARKTW